LRHLPQFPIPRSRKKRFQNPPWGCYHDWGVAILRINGDGSAGLVPGFRFLAERGVGMESLRELLEAVRGSDVVQGRFRGLLHILVGRRVTREDGTVVSAGMTWRDVAALLKRLRWDREMVRELGIDPSHLAPRDRERFWYTAISRAGIDSPEAVATADQLVEPLKKMGFVVGPAPGTK
jgi:hypothetical protein